MKNKNSVCLAIPTYNREEALVGTLRTAFALRPAPDEILVIDQTRRHEKATEAFLRAAGKRKGFRWISQQPPSVTAARNRAIAETKSEVIIFIDDDVLMPKNFAARHMRNYLDKNIQAVAGGVDQEKKPRFPPSPAGGWPRLLDYKYFSVYDQKRTVGVANFMGCNHSVRTAVLRKLGGYDNLYVGSALMEETDMALRIWKSGRTIVFDPEARLTHLAVPTGGCRIPVGRKVDPEWWVPFNRHYFSFRHLWPGREFWWSILAKDFRQSVLRKSNLKRPWRIPFSFAAYIYSLGKAWRAATTMGREDHPS